MKDPTQANLYWQKNLLYLLILLSIWFVVSYGLGILLAEPLNSIRIGGFKLGFWFAQQGSIYTFVCLIFVYVVLMNKLDKAYRAKSIPVPKWIFKRKSIWISLVLCVIIIWLSTKWVAFALTDQNYWPLLIVFSGCLLVTTAMGLRKRKTT